MAAVQPAETIFCILLRMGPADMLLPGHCVNTTGMLRNGGALCANALNDRNLLATFRIEGDKTPGARS